VPKFEQRIEPRHPALWKSAQKLLKTVSVNILLSKRCIAHRKPYAGLRPYAIRVVRKQNRVAGTKLALPLKP
jgi:hypothetical protein